MIGIVDGYKFVSVPTGIIIPWVSDSAVPPTGWTLFTAPNNAVVGFSGCYIVGAGDVAGGHIAVNASGIGKSAQPIESGQVVGDGHAQFTSTSDGAHGPTPRVTGVTGAAKSSYSAWTTRYGGGETAGSHNHIVDVIPTLGFNQYQFIKATIQAEKFPANSVLLNTIHSSFPDSLGLTQVGTDSKYLRAGNLTGSAATSLQTSILYDYNSAPPMLSGRHRHDWKLYARAAAGANNTWRVRLSNEGAKSADGLDGYHVHDINAQIVDKIKKVYVTAWSKATDFYGFRGTIAFWDGALSAIPSGWALCDGTNGSIDMQDHFIMMSTNTNRGTKTGTNVIDVTPLSGNMFSMNNFGRPGTDENDGHKHYERETNSDGISSFLTAAVGVGGNISTTFSHTQIAVNHDHPLTQGTDLAFYPQYYALYIIQKL